MDVILPCVKAYAWGSRHVIAELQGRAAPTQGPEAELWMGAHPSGPSGVVRHGVRRTLDQVIADDPAGELGRDVMYRFGGRLPFMLKVLAAENALSIQVHPDREQARLGFAAEEAAGLDRTDPTRSYVDDWPKPEILVALTEFEVLAGFRRADDSARILRALGVPALDPIIAELEVGSGDSRPLALRHILQLPAEEAATLADATAAAATRLAGDDNDDAQSYAAVVRMAREHPGDAGAVASLLLCHATLAPGEGLYMPATGPHAYLHGAGVEVMANSDNVLRAGLTHKHIDVPELLRIIDPAMQVPVLRPDPDALGIRTYSAPVPEFCLYSAELNGRAAPVPGHGPRIVLVTAGEATLTCDGDDVHLSQGQACFLPAGAAQPKFRSSGTVGTAYIAAAGESLFS